MPLFFVEDDALPLTTYIMKQFDYINLSSVTAHFNERRQEADVENAFGIMASRLEYLENGKMSIQQK